MKAMPLVLTARSHEEITRHIVESILARVSTASSVYAGESGAAQASEEETTLLRWLLFDAFFVDVPIDRRLPIQIGDLVRFLQQRMPANRWGHTPVSLFWFLRRAIAPRCSVEVPLGWNENPAVVRAALPKSDVDWCVDWGIDVVLECMLEFEECRSMLDEVLCNADMYICNGLPTLGQVANYLWRAGAPAVRSIRISPRFDVSLPLAESTLGGDLARLFAVMGFSDRTTHSADESLRDLFGMARNKYAATTPALTTLFAEHWTVSELRATFGIRAGRIREFILGDLSRKLPSGILRFADLIQYVDETRSGRSGLGKA